MIVCDLSDFAALNIVDVPKAFDEIYTIRYLSDEISSLCIVYIFFFALFGFWIEYRGHEK